MSWAAEHLEQVVLPWWDEHGADDLDGGVWSCFSNDGRQQSRDKYTWSQGRWAWLCAELAADGAAGLLDVDADRWRGRAVATASFLVDHAVRPDGRTWFRTDTRGVGLVEPGQDPAASVFADLFAVLGLAGAHRWAPKAGFDTVAATVLQRAEQLVSSGDAPMAPYPVRSGFDDLASAMTLLHTGSELSRATGDPAGSGVAGRAAARLLDVHFPRVDDWWELNPQDASDTDTLLARHRTPGHLLECLWMIVHAVDVDGSLERPELPQRLAALALRAFELGWDDAYGGMLRYADRDGGQPAGRRFGDDAYESLVEQTWHTKLWWVHVESLYTAALLADRVPDRRDELRGWYDRLHAWTMATFPDPGGAEWIQIRDRTGAPLNQVVALPVKDPFHIARSLLLLHRLDAHPTTGAPPPTGAGDTHPRRTDDRA